MDARLHGRSITRQASDRSDDFAGFAFGTAPDRTTGVAIDGFGINGAARAGGSGYSVFTVFSGQSRGAGFALFALRARRSCGTWVALISLGTLEASAERYRDDAQDGKRWKTTAIIAEIFHWIAHPVRPPKTESRITEIQIKYGPLNVVRCRLFPQFAR